MNQKLQKYMYKEAKLRLQHNSALLFIHRIIILGEFQLPQLSLLDIQVETKVLSQYWDWKL